MSIREQIFVVFESPGTMFCETTELMINAIDLELAASMSKHVSERHGAKPFGFWFTTKLLHDPIPDGRGGTLDVEPKVLSKSNFFYLSGTVKTYDDIPDTAENHILRTNMRGNHFGVVVENNNSWKVMRPFKETDTIIDERGQAVKKGNDPELVTYRAAFLKRFPEG